MSSASTPALPPPPATTRKVPLPCWTHDETLALIDTYRDRWIALRRGYLRTADWDAVASAVAQRCRHVTPPKSSDQCRHKMEKLRQRYRAEKQRCVAFPGRFFSAWVFFKVLSFLDDGGGSAQTKKRAAEAKAVDPVRQLSSDDGFFLTALGDRKFTIDLKTFAKIDDQIQNSSFGIRRNVPSPPEQNIEPSMNRYASGLNHSFSRDDVDDDLHEQISLHKGSFIRPDKAGTAAGYAGRNLVFDVDGGFNLSGGVSGKLHSSMKFVDSKPKITPNHHQAVGDNGEGVDPLAEMATSIKLLGDGFLKMEKMRMEMAVEFEKARIEVELKRNELIMESQRRIVDAFMRAAKRKKTKKEVHSET
uniref:Myb-like domain-containing protein n=1 Tax=Kalanchoe fedtschenkoi TaxID=63787 RepID=A0A7N0VM98_KALFE